MANINDATLIEEAWRQLEEAVMKGYITLTSGEVVEVGTRKAAELLRVAENMVKRAPKRQKRLYTVEDFSAQDTSST